MKRVFIITVVLAAWVMLFAPAATVMAAPAAPAPKDALIPPDKCVGIALPVDKSVQCKTKEGKTGISNDPKTGGAIVNYLRPILRLLSGAVGLLIILMLIVAGIQYITSVGDPNNIKMAKTRIVNAVIALLLYLMMFAILNFLIPGGILS